MKMLRSMDVDWCRYVALWRERALTAIAWLIAIIVCCAMTGAALYFLASSFNHFVRERTKIERCQNNALTPRDYHRC